MKIMQRLCETWHPLLQKLYFFQEITLVSFLCTWISYKDTFHCLRIKFIPLLFRNMDKTSRPKHFWWNWNISALGHRSSTGLFPPKTLEGILFIRNVAVEHPIRPKGLWNIHFDQKALITSNKSLFFHSTTPILFGCVWKGSLHLNSISKEICQKFF